MTWGSAVLTEISPSVTGIAVSETFNRCEMLDRYVNSDIMKLFLLFSVRFLTEGWKGAKECVRMREASEGGEECDCGSTPQGDSRIACPKPSHQWAGSLGS